MKEKRAEFEAQSNDSDEEDTPLSFSQPPASLPKRPRIIPGTLLSASIPDTQDDSLNRLIESPIKDGLQVLDPNNISLETCAKPLKDLTVKTKIRNHPSELFLILN